MGDGTVIEYVSATIAKRDSIIQRRAGFAHGGRVEIRQYGMRLDCPVAGCTTCVNRLWRRRQRERAVEKLSGPNRPPPAKKRSGQAVLRSVADYRVEPRP